MAERPRYRRIVLGLPYSRPGRGIHMAADMARLLQLDLFGLFVEEERLFGLAAMPFVREFRSIGGCWNTFDVDQLTQDLSIAARNAEKVFTEVAKTVPTAARFEVVRGTMPDIIASISGAGDIVVVAEPENPADHASAQFRAIADAAIRSQAAVLLVPERVARQTGSIVAILSSADDPCFEVAVSVAAAAKEELIVIEAFAAAEPSPRRETQVAAGVRYRRIAVAENSASIAAQLASPYPQDEERLVVMSSRDLVTPSLIGSARHVPILIVGSARIADRSEQSNQSVC
jgi:hypothetical protein